MTVNTVPQVVSVNSASPSTTGIRSRIFSIRMCANHVIVIPPDHLEEVNVKPSLIPDEPAHPESLGLSLDAVFVSEMLVEGDATPAKMASGICLNPTQMDVNLVIVTQKEP